MNYDQMSDFEINRAVATALGITNWYVKPNSEMNETDSWLYSDNVEGDALHLKNYCNNPSDAWPIITENRIAISPYCDQGWFADHDSSVIVDDANPLRAAMLVYLMMQEHDK